MRRRLSSLLVLALVAGLLTAANVPAKAAGPLDLADAEGQVKAGYGEADASWHVGAGAGQYSGKSPQDPATGAAGGDVDPQSHSAIQQDSYGVQSRLSYRAIVVQDAQGDQVAYVKSDSYLAQDYLSRRVGQILAKSSSSVSYDEIFLMASHNHSSPYYTSPSWGVWLFQDAFDIRAFEYHARAMATAILRAEQSMVDARMGATIVDHRILKGMIQRKTLADDGTPGGYPDDFGDFGLSVVRFDNIEDPENPKPLATLINWGQHPESLDPHRLITGDYVASLERYVERSTGAPLVFGQGDVGSAESGPGRPDLVPPGIPKEWSHFGHAQAERGGFLLAQDVIKGWEEIESGTPKVPFSSSFDVAAGNAWVPGPLSHPYPSISNCRTETTAEGSPGAPVAGLPDCERGSGADKNSMIWENLKAEGIPVPDEVPVPKHLPLPENYDAPSFTGVEENLRLHLQAFKMGEVLLASCACEAQVDLILNLESRADNVERNIWDGFDWTTRMDCTQAAPPAGDWTCSKKPSDPRPSAVLAPMTFSDARYQRMQAQIHNDARGWDAPGYVPWAGSEPADPTEIKGNFTKEELPSDLGYALPIGVGHAGDYNGYTVSYREYQSYDGYRKALTSYGPHTADYMVTRLVRLAGELNGGPALQPEPHDAMGQADEARQVGASTALGIASNAIYDAWLASLPSDKGPAISVTEPKNVKRFDAATFSWRGGSNAVDNPLVGVERLVDGEWTAFADQSGEIQTKVQFPKGIQGLTETYAGNKEWVWTANFEAFDPFPVEIGSTPAGEYRFVVDGNIKLVRGQEPSTYHLESGTFTVKPWDGLQVSGLGTGSDGATSFTVAPIAYPQTYTSVFPYIKSSGKTFEGKDVIKNDMTGTAYCTVCSFRPWAIGGQLASARVTVLDSANHATKAPVECTPTSGGAPNQPTGYSCSTSTSVPAGGSVIVFPGDVADLYGETVARCVGTQGPMECPVIADPEPSPTVPVATSLDVEGSPGSGQYTDEVVFVARLVTSSGEPLPNEEVSFELSGETKRFFAARTDGDGIARVTVQLTEPPGPYYLWAHYAGREAAFDPSTSAPKAFVVEREDTNLELSSTGKGSKKLLVARLTEDGSPVANRLIDFFANDTVIASVRTDETGRASTEIPSGYRGSNQRYRARFNGDDYFKGSSSSAI